MGKKVDLELLGTDGNAFMVLGAFSRQAKKEGWTAEEISKITNEATKGDYDHLLQTILSYTN